MNSTKSTADALYCLGYWLLDQQRYEDAKHVFRSMLLVAPTDDRGWLALGACHEASQELDKAARLYALARQACTTSIRSVVALGRILRKLDRDAEADEVYAEAAELVSDTDDMDLAVTIRTEARGA